MRITILGTSAMLPTKERNPTSIMVEYEKEGILIDCGEGTQRQMRIAGIKPTKITKILISHFHGDHVLGIPGLIQSLGASEYRGTLEIYGPEKSSYYIRNMLKGFEFRERIKFKIYELKDSKRFFSNKELEIYCKKLKHDIPCLAYSIKEKDKLKINTDYTKKFGLTKHPLLGKLQQGRSIMYKKNHIDVKKATITKQGKKISIVLDTSFDKSIKSFVKNSDLLICDSTWDSKTEKRKGSHLTNLEAATLARESVSKKLVLTHFSQRYKTVDNLLKETRKKFRNTIAAKDLMKLSI